MDNYEGMAVSIDIDNLRRMLIKLTESVSALEARITILEEILKRVPNELVSEEENI